VYRLAFDTFLADRTNGRAYAVQCSVCL